MKFGGMREQRTSVKLVALGEDRKSSSFAADSMVEDVLSKLTVFRSGVLITERISDDISGKENRETCTCSTLISWFRCEGTTL